MSKWSVPTLTGRSCKWERMDAINFLHTTEMWPRIQTPPGLLFWSHTLFGSVSLHLQLLLLQRNHITEDDDINDHHLWGKESISAWQERSVKAPFSTLSVQKNNLQNADSLSKPGFEFESSYQPGLLQEPATRGCCRHSLLHQPHLIPLHHRCWVQLLFLIPPRV